MGPLKTFVRHNKQTSPVDRRSNEALSNLFKPRTVFP